MSTAIVGKRANERQWLLTRAVGHKLLGVKSYAAVACDVVVSIS
jgi:hypothetical protein